MITTIGVAFILVNIVLMVWGPQTQPLLALSPTSAGPLVKPK